MDCLIRMNASNMSELCNPGKRQKNIPERALCSRSKTDLGAAGPATLRGKWPEVLVPLPLCNLSSIVEESGLSFRGTASLSPANAITTLEFAKLGSSASFCRDSSLFPIGLLNLLSIIPPSTDWHLDNNLYCIVSLFQSAIAPFNLFSGLSLLPFWQSGLNLPAAQADCKIWFSTGTWTKLCAVLSCFSCPYSHPCFL